MTGSVKKIIFCIFLMILIKNSFGQDDDYFKKENKLKFDKSRIYFGGNLGSLEFGSTTSIDLAPVAGYRFTDKLSAGLGVSFKYYSDNTNYFNTCIYGGRIVVNYAAYKYILTQAEGDVLSFESRYWDTNGQFSKQPRFIYPAVYIGGGYMQKMGEHSFAFFMILWNLLDAANSPYQNPDLRIGFTF
jgi:hypothetical protein